jgi:hypothetical protein
MNVTTVASQRNHVKERVVGNKIRLNSTNSASILIKLNQKRIMQDGFVCLTRDETLDLIDALISVVGSSD